MGQIKGQDRGILAIVLGDGTAPEERLAFYAGVFGPSAERDLVAQTGDAEAEALAELVMASFGLLSAEVVRRRLGSLRVQAASKVRAQAPQPRSVRLGSGRYSIEAVEPRHAGFFGLDAMTLRHEKFEGGDSPALVREVFTSGDAVTVLPYDPVRDRVLVIEQFRVGPLGRGDPFPWQIEGIAGRIDPGETPEAAARREAVEEAGLTLGALVPVAGYYPTPGAVSEFLYSYVALCDLPDGIAGVFGAEEEAEDIRGHLLSFDGLMQAVATGEVSNAPLLLTALWLQRERPRLRREV